MRRKRPLIEPIRTYEDVAHAPPAILPRVCHACLGSGVERFDAGLPERCSLCKGYPYGGKPSAQELLDA